MENDVWCHLCRITRNVDFSIYFGKYFVINGVDIVHLGIRWLQEWCVQPTKGVMHSSTTSLWLLQKMMLGVDANNEGNYNELFKFLIDDQSNVLQQSGCKIKQVESKHFLRCFFVIMLIMVVIHDVFLSICLCCFCVILLAFVCCWLGMTLYGLLIRLLLVILA